jgi:hypothetical protein
MKKRGYRTEKKNNVVVFPRTKGIYQGLDLAITQDTGLLIPL